MPKKLKPIPAFANEKEERLFWETHDSFDYVDWGNAVRVRIPNLKLSSEKSAVVPAGDSATD